MPLYLVYIGTKSKYIKYNYILSIYGYDDSIGCSIIRLYFVKSEYPFRYHLVKVSLKLLENIFLRNSYMSQFYL